MHKTKNNLQPAFNQSEVGKINPDRIKTDENCRHTATIIVSAMKLIGEQKLNRKTVC